MNARWAGTAALAMLSMFLLALPMVHTTAAYLSGTATGEIAFAVGQLPVEPPVEPGDPDIPAECGPAANYDQVIKVANPEVALLLYDLSGNDVIILTRALPGGWLDGKEGDDCVVGNDGTDRIFGGPGNDILVGRGGNDILTDADGDNAMYGGSGGDSCLGTGEKVDCENAPSLPGGSISTNGDRGTDAFPPVDGDESGTGDRCLPVRGRPARC